MHSNFLVEKLNRINIKKKLMIIQIVCVILPLLITDSVILGLIINAENRANQQEMINIADSVKYTIVNFVEPKVLMMQKCYTNRSINEFMHKEFVSPLDYYNQYTQLVSNNMYITNADRCSFVFYADNPNVINGGCFQRLDKIQDKDWYKYFQERNEEVSVFADFETEGVERRRRIYVVRKMDYYAKNINQDIVRMDMDYSELMRIIINSKYSYPVYVCSGDYVIFSNDGKGGLHAPFEYFYRKQKKNAGATTTLTIYGSSLDIYVMKNTYTTFDTIHKNLSLLVTLVCINILLPYLVMRLINKSFIDRIRMLDSVLKNADKEELYQLSEISGTDEISMLMSSYNRMAERINNLIQRVYYSSV